MKMQVHAHRKLNSTAAWLGIITAFAVNARADDPRTNSWFTTYSGKYARSFPNAASGAASVMRMAFVSRAR